jgi:hypothetical protein
MVFTSGPSEGCEKGKGTMAMMSPADTAKIYEFPAGGRKSGGRRFEQSATIADIRPKQVLTVDYSNWYHDEAIREEQKPKS